MKTYFLCACMCTYLCVCAPTCKYIKIDLLLVKFPSCIYARVFVVIAFVGAHLLNLISFIYNSFLVCSSFWPRKSFLLYCYDTTTTTTIIIIIIIIIIAVIVAADIIIIFIMNRIKLIVAIINIVFVKLLKVIHSIVLSFSNHSPQQHQ